MVGRPSWVTNAGKWEEEERTIAWRSPESVTVTEESLDSFSQYVLGAVIDATGESWLTSERDPILVPHWDEPVRERVILPVGAPVVTAKHKERVARLKVLGAEGIWWQGMSDENYVHAVASILRAQALSPR